MHASALVQNGTAVQAVQESAATPPAGRSWRKNPAAQLVHCEFAAVVQVSSLVHCGTLVQLAHWSWGPSTR